MRQRRTLCRRVPLALQLQRTAESLCLLVSSRQIQGQHLDRLRLLNDFFPQLLRTPVLTLHRQL